ncbi:class I histocompatibility antigen, F10 alpha chain isoform X3 [Oreochromis niloticus]|uniref:class I histocompatibility antigen, F10 alpha chain isoform X3 n=1 Tax=Oreochromis niloticus TaxID=8128 RepID=UPI0006740E65|nr:class I histocompatibility antigen, F10 alpha chain isoform X3 [Oreochromis niloticus]
MNSVLILLLCCHVASPVKHSLKYFFTESPGAQSIPEFVAVAIVDDVQIGDSNSVREATPKKDWIKFFEDHPQHLQWYSLQSHDSHHFFKATIETLRQRLNQTEVLPKVSLLQKTPSSPVSCHATGFYPDRAVMFWRKDGVQLHEGVDPGEILPNNDGTFQMSIDLNVSSVTPEDWQRYDCVFQLAGVNEHIITKLDKTAIRTNWAEKPADMVTFISAAVVLLTVTIITAVAFVAYKKKKAPDDGSEQSERLNPQS